MAGGIVGLALVAANRIFLAGELAFGDQSRADLLAVAATMGLILDGLSQVDVETRESEVVQLRGERGRGVSSSLSDDDAKSARWAAKAIRTIESVKTVVLYHDGKTILREGVLGASRDVDAAIRVADLMETGTVQVNGPPARGPDHFPFQGTRDSGIGSQGIINSIETMTKTKSVVINLAKPSYALA